MPKYNPPEGAEKRRQLSPERAVFPQKTQKSYDGLLVFLRTGRRASRKIRSHFDEGSKTYSENLLSPWKNG